MKYKADSVDHSIIPESDKDFGEYARMAVDHALSNIAPDERITALDKKFIGLIAAMENAQRPGLNLLYLPEAPRNLQFMIERIENGGMQGNFRFIFHPSENSVHCAMADVRVGSNETSIVIADSAFEHSDTRLESAADLLRAEGRKISIITPEIQKSTQDCIMYALNFAIKSYKTGFTGEIHGKNNAQIISSDQLKNLPIGFLKHTQTRAILKQEYGLAEAFVKKNSSERLSDRHASYRVRRINNDSKEFETSASIEGFRLREIRKTGEALSKGSGAFDRSLLERLSSMSRSLNELEYVKNNGERDERLKAFREWRVRTRQ
ncbi:YopJ family acetyltransferase [Paraburkholderia sp. Cy-641]|uniref:YopJ family acetyltransferase n=1 Tax=Paraburkholderia sp. Cy-641 TaxID=2608337 RepID=UPI001421C34D|nr:YopJ family acetyltransferase [Paraburkholderia sp. Cy-641]